MISSCCFLRFRLHAFQIARNMYEMKAGFQGMKCVIAGLKGHYASGKPMSFSGVEDMSVDMRMEPKARAIELCGIL